MDNEIIVEGLTQLGFTTGWVATGNQITFWSNLATQPTEKEILEASKQWRLNVATRLAEKATAKAALLERLGITADEAALLLS